MGGNGILPDKLPSHRLLDALPIYYIKCINEYDHCEYDIACIRTVHIITLNALQFRIRLILFCYDFYFIEYDKLIADISSKFWFTYRKNYPPIGRLHPSIK